VPFKHQRHQSVGSASNGGELLKDGIAFRAFVDGRFHGGYLLQETKAGPTDGPGAVPCGSWG
jgi:hypothetical protein